MSNHRIDFVDMNVLLPKNIRDEVHQNETHYIIQCPHCIATLGYTKEKLYITKDLKYGWCFRQNHVYINRSLDMVEVDLLTSDVESLRFSMNKKFSFSMDKYYEASEVIDERAIEYFIHTRHNPLLVSKYEDYGLRFDNDGVFIPFKIDGEYKYYTKRLYNSRIKYYLPPIMHKPYYFLEGTKKDVWVLCEGCFDAIAISMMNEELNVIGLQGSTITKYQLEELRKILPPNIIIWLDDFKLSLGVKRIVDKNIPFTSTRIINSRGADPEECLIDYHGFKN